MSRQGDGLGSFVERTNCKIECPFFNSWNVIYKLKRCYCCFTNLLVSGHDCIILEPKAQETETHRFAESFYIPVVWQYFLVLLQRHKHNSAWNNPFTSKGARTCVYLGDAPDCTILVQLGNSNAFHHKSWRDITWVEMKGNDQTLFDCLIDRRFTLKIFGSRFIVVAVDNSSWYFMVNYIQAGLPTASVSGWWEVS